jgi:superfamily II DNA/RNA helicase
MEQHILLYTKYIHEDLSTIDIDIASYKEQLHKSFEWFACIKLSLQYNSIFLRWEDVPPQLREEKGMLRDMGIDAWDISGNRVSQMKLYQGCISWRNFATFLSCCDVFENSLKILYRTEHSTICDMIQFRITKNIITDITVSDSTFRSECKRIQGLSLLKPTLSNTFVIRPYQIESISYLEKGRDSNQNVYLCIPTGCGKTVIILQYHIKYCTDTLLVLVPRVVLMGQWGEECKKLSINNYLIGTGHHHNMDEYKNETIVICVYDSLPNIYDKMNIFTQYCIDEAHHVKTPERYMDTETEHEIYYDSENDDEVEVKDDEPMSYIECIQSLSDTKRVIYISATLDPPDDDSLFYEYKVRRAIEEEYLCDYQFVFPIFEQDHITNEHLAYYLVHKQHESHCVIYAPSCKEAQEFTQCLNDLQNGCAGYIDADTTYKDRQRLFAEFESGQLKFLINIRILVEGFNAPHIRSIFFLKVSTSEIFIIQAIGRALRKHQDKLLATIYVPFTHESDMERIKTFISQLSTYDERINKTISQKTIGGYISIEHGEEIIDDEKEDDTMDRFEFRYNLIIERMGNSNMMDEIQMKIALEYKAFYRENNRMPIQCLKSKSNIKKEKASDREKQEHNLAKWFYRLKRTKRLNRYTIYQPVEVVMIELFGEKWYEKIDKEVIALQKAHMFQEFYIAYKRKPILKLQGKSKEQKEKASTSEKQEHTIASWFSVIKRYHRLDLCIYLSIENILKETLGEKWYENENVEEQSLQIAKKFKEFYIAHKRLPKSVLQKKSKDDKEKATDSEKQEHELATWFGRIKGCKRGYNNGTIVYTTVEDIFIEILGESWYEKDDKEEGALQKAEKFKEFYIAHKRLPKSVLQKKSKEDKEKATDSEKQEHELATWFGDMKKSKKSYKDKNSIVYPSVEDVLNTLLGEKWYENSLEPNALLWATEFKEFITTYKRTPCLKLQSKSKEDKEKATDSEKQEHELARWFCRMKESKKEKSTCVLYPSVEKILIERLGSGWFI